MKNPLRIYVRLRTRFRGTIVVRYDEIRRIEPDDNGQTCEVTLEGAKADGSIGDYRNTLQLKESSRDVESKLAKATMIVG